VGREAAGHYATLFGHALSCGVYLAPSAFEVGFLSSAHSEADVDVLAAALEGGLRKALRSR
jgi:glutamate-1-semialdehyde 2,1-aminomutase